MQRARSSPLSELGIISSRSNWLNQFLFRLFLAECDFFLAGCDFFLAGCNPKSSMICYCCSEVASFSLGGLNSAIARAWAISFLKSSLLNCGVCTINAFPSPVKWSDLILYLTAFYLQIQDLLESTHFIHPYHLMAFSLLPSPLRLER